MLTSLSRREFISYLSTLVGASAVPTGALAGVLGSPPDRSAKPTASAIRFGYAAITWGGDDLQAIKDISAVGFKGIQLRANVLKDYGDRPKALRDVLDQYHLELVALSSGSVGIALGKEADEMAKHLQHAKFVREVGGYYLQLVDLARPKDRKPTAEDFKQLGRIMTEIGKRANDLGIPVGYHNHMHSLGEAPDEVDRIMDATDPRYIKLELDVAHYKQGGGDPAKAIRRYRDRLLFLHIKDVESPVPGTAGQSNRPYRFVELGRGNVDLPAVFAALKEIRFRGWAVVELDSVPDKARTPKESALISKTYLQEKLGLSV